MSVPENETLEEKLDRYGRELHYYMVKIEICPAEELDQLEGEVATLCNDLDLLLEEIKLLNSCGRKTKDK